MISDFRKYYRFETAILLLPIFLFIVMRFIFGFNGLYGQDSHEYFRYSRAITDFLITGSSPGDYFWPIYYPVFGSILGFIFGNLLSLQLISVLSFSGTLYFLFKIMEIIFEDRNHLAVYLIITFLLSPLIFRNSFVVMSDLLTIFFITASFYFFINYLHNTELKQIVLFSFFSSLAILTRYAAAVVLLIPALVFVQHMVKNKKFYHLIYSSAILVLLSFPHILIRQSNSTDFLGHTWLQEWSIANLFKSDFITQEGTQHYRFPNIIYSFSSIFYPAYMVFGLVLAVLSERNLPKNIFWLIAVGIILTYALFLSGIPFQNQRYLLLSYPFVVLSVYPGFQRLTSILEKRKTVFFMSIFVMLVLQVFYCIYYFKPVYERNKLEKEISDFVKNYSHKNVYAFDIDVSFMSYDVNKNIINMWKEKISEFNSNSIVIFNETKFKDQWSGKNPMINWTELKLNYNLQQLKDFGDGWTVFEIKNK